MAKDYAKRIFTTTRKPKKKRLRVELFVIPIVILACLGGYWAYRHKAEFGMAPSGWMAQLKTLVAHKSSAKSLQTANMKPISETKPEPDVHFDFYNELPNMQVTLSEVAEEAAPKPPKIHDPESPLPKQATVYLLQLGLFKDAVEASQLRLSLLLSGIEAEVVKINSSGDEMFRVQRGPFVDQAEAKKLQRELQKKGIVSVVRKG